MEPGWPIAGHPGRRNLIGTERFRALGLVGYDVAAMPPLCERVICRSATPTANVMTPAIQAVQAIGRVSLNPMTQGEMKKSTPMRAVKPSMDIMSGLTSSTRARTAVTAPSTIIVMVALSVVAVHKGESIA